jgi:hypothetical protein
VLAEKEHLPGEDNEERLTFTPRRGGWSLDAKTPDGFRCVAVRVARTADGATHRLYKYTLTPEAVRELRQRADEAEAEIIRTDLVSEIAETRADIGRLQQHLVELQREHAEKFSTRGKETAPIVCSES